MSAPKFVWFDFGGVLSPPIPELFTQYQRKTGIAPAALQQAMQDVADDLGLPMLAPIENAVLSEVEWGARLAEALRRNDPSLDLSRARLEQFGQQWFSGVEPNPAMREAALQLKAAGYRVGILTNNVVEWEPYWRELVGLDTVVDLVVDSSHERCRKPDARFFDIAARRAGLAPAQNLLIDDVAENIEAAAALGWQTLHFRGNPGALSALEALTGIPLRAPQEALAS